MADEKVKRFMVVETVIKIYSIFVQGRATDHKNINLAELHRQVVRSESRGKIVWQPRIDCWYRDKIFSDGALPEPYTGMTRPEIYRKLGCSARIYEYNDCFQRVDHPEVKKYSNRVSDTETEHIVETPIGKISTITATTPSSWAEKREKWWITGVDDLRVAAWAEERCEWKWNEEHFQRTHEEWRDLGAPTIFMPRVNIQRLYIDMMGVEQAIYALHDYPASVDKYFQVLDESHERLIEVINRSPIDIINFGDNVHAGTLPPTLFQKYVLPSYQRRNELLHGAGKFTYAHWDGEVKALLPYARECGLDGIEAITPEPQGDVSTAEVKEALGDEMFLIDGIAAVLFDETFSLEDLLRQAKEIIELFASKLILGISDEISSTGDIERIRVIGELVDDYNASIYIG